MQIGAWYGHLKGTAYVVNLDIDRNIILKWF